jgi:GTP cyclohydrolase I
MAIDYDKLQAAVRMILEAVGENPDREGLIDTPKRVAKMYAEVFEGLGKNPEEELSAIFNEMHEEVVIVKDIPFFSMCEHHLVPFYGKVHVAYIPRNGQVTGLSKLARVVETVARQPQLQERITSTVADTIVNKLNPHGVAVIVEAEHMCMTMRGVKKPGASTITTSVRGIYQESPEARAEVFSLMRG